MMSKTWRWGKMLRLGRTVGLRAGLPALLLTLLLSAGCNYPGAPISQGTPVPAGTAFWQTVEAMAAQTLAAEGGQPVPPDAPAPTQTAMRQTAQAIAVPTLTAAPLPVPVTNLPGPNGWAVPQADGNYLYTTQPGDSLPALALRFDAPPETIAATAPLPPQGLLRAGQVLLIPMRLPETPYAAPLLPDSELVNSPTALDLDLYAFIVRSGGVLSTHSERVGQETLSGAQIVERVAVESSINPRLLLAWIELRSGWVSGMHPAPRNPRYPLGFSIANWEGLYKELVITATHLNGGYYGWRDGSMTSLTFINGRKVRLAPGLNAGSVGVQNMLTRLLDGEAWNAALYGPDSLSVVYSSLFGDPWARAAAFGPLLPDDLAQPELSLPIPPGERWSYTGGPHAAWKTGSPRGAIDLAPVTGEPACVVSRAWALAAADGVIVRAERNVVVLDLDGDGFEQSGWNVFYLHLASKDLIADGVAVRRDTRLGHPSCEGGQVTGTHIHLARKYNGEWLAAAAPLPFVLSGWTVFAGDKNYQGELRNGDQVVTASPVGPRTSIVVR